MRWLSESVESLIAEQLCDVEGNKVVHDVVVVGSGYGGAVAALRLAERGFEVLVLERGEEYLPGEFPNDIANLPKHIRVERWNHEPMGYESGLFDLRIGKNAGVLVGNALGGTSQINANVAIRPDPRVFANARWPQAIRNAGAAGLEEYFELARETLEVEKFHGLEVRASGKPGLVLPEKTRALRALSERLQRLQRQLGGGDLEVSFDTAELTVNLPGSQANHQPGVPQAKCVGKGDCVTGCNQFAKNTLTTTYLPKARARGAKMFTGVSVLTLERDPKRDCWKLGFVRTLERAALRKRGAAQALTQELFARSVILAAGTLGSTEILSRSAGALGLAGEKSLLGRRFSGNGDYLAFGYMQDERVNAIGRGSRERIPGNLHPVGPTITASISIKDTRDVSKSTLIEEGSVPGAIAGLFHELATTTATVSQLSKWSYRGEKRAHPEVDPLVLQSKGLSHTQTLLAMGHDSASGELRYDEEHDRLRIEWQEADNAEVYARHDQRLGKIADLGAIYLQNPAWHPLPDSVRDVLSGPKLGNGMFSVHPLGGCPMGEAIDSGVVNDIGAVYSASGGTHGGLYVLDGSIIPCALGVNPLLTITALAERAMPLIAAQIGPPSSSNRVPPAFPEFPLEKLRDVYRNPNSEELSLEFTEVLRGELATQGALGAELPGSRSASLILHLPIADLKAFFANPTHPISIRGSKGADSERLDAKLCIGAPAQDQTDTCPKAEDPATRVAAAAPWEFEVVDGSVAILQRRQPAGLRWLDAYLRVLLTWLIDRGWDEIRRDFRDRFRRWFGLGKRQLRATAGSDTGSGILAKLCALRKLANHATESRIFAYELNLSRGGEAYRLSGSKAFSYAARWTALFAYLRARLSGEPLCGLYLQRRNVWTSLGQLDVELYDQDQALVASGSLSMDMVDMTHRHAAQLAMKRDSASALVMFAGYPLLFLRAIIKMRLWDFRLPDYPECLPLYFSQKQDCVPLPAASANPDTPWPVFPRLRCEGRSAGVAPETSVEFPVRKSRDDGAQVSLKLTRYKASRLVSGHTAGGTIQVKAIMLMNGFAQPTLPFVAPEIEQNMAECFYARGYDVWLFDYRSSTILDASKQGCTMDDIANYDIPGAVDKILETLRNELGCGAEPKLQIYAFAHCVGSAAMAMSLLAGKLAYDDAASKIAGVILSQMQPFLVGGKTCQMRLQVASFLRDVAGIEVLRLSAAEKQSSAFESLLDRLFASLPVTDAERCPHENDRFDPRPGIATCKRMSGTISRLLKHDQILEETHDKLSVYFGRANTTLFIHGAKCVEYERLVNADGQNVYVTDDNIRKHFSLPMAFLHGRENALFDFESFTRTLQQLTRVNGKAFAGEYYYPVCAEGYAHFDCTVGKNAHEEGDIFPRLGAFLDQAWRQNAEGIKRNPLNAQYPLPSPRSEARAPVSGPLVGWTRAHADGAKRLVRLWMQVDEYETDPAQFALTVVRGPSGASPPRCECWPIIRIPLEQARAWLDPDGRALTASGRPLPQGIGYVAIAMADLELEANDEGHDVDMVSVHFFPYGVAGKSPDAKNTPLPPPLAPEDSPEDHPMMLPPGYRPIAEAGSGSDAPGARAPFVEQLKYDLANGDPITPTGSILAEEAECLLATLRARVLETRRTALDPNPPTLSRKKRDLPSLGSWTAHLKRRTLTGPGVPGNLRFLAACCRYPGMAFEANRSDAALGRINELLQADDAHRDFMLLVGDQIYADATAGLFDVASPVEKFRVRYEQAFSTREFRALAAQLPLYLAPDDHEIDDNWSLDELAEGSAAKRLFYTAAASYSAYQWAHSPRRIDAHTDANAVPGFNYAFTAGGYDFLVLDTRTQRVRHSYPPRLPDRPPELLVAEQLRLLQDWLQERKDRRAPKFVVTGSVLAPGLWQSDLPYADRMADNWQLAREQRERVLGWIRDQSIPNVVFISGDYHCAASAKLEFDGGAEIKAYALVSPPLYAPFPYANVPCSAVMRTETLAAGGGNVSISANVRDGNGFMDIRIDGPADGPWGLEITTHALRLEDGNPSFLPVSEHFTLS